MGNSGVHRSGLKNMQTYKTITVPAKPAQERIVGDKLFCDVCGKEEKNTGWQTPAFDINETEIRHKYGSIFPEGGSWEETDVDICPECFKDKFIPWIESFGITKVKYKYKDV